MKKINVKKSDILSILVNAQDRYEDLAIFARETKNDNHIYYEMKDRYDRCERLFWEISSGTQICIIDDSDEKILY